MKETKNITFAGLLCVLSLVALTPHFARAQATQPAGKPDAAVNPDDDFVISGMRVQELKGINYEFVGSTTSLHQLGDSIRQATGKIAPLIKSGDVRPQGPLLIIFHGVNGDPDQQFPFEVGFPVAEETKVVDGLQIKQLDKFRCATVIYSGPMSQIKKAYSAVYNDLLNEGLEPTDEGRQSVLMFEGDDSVNNVALIEVGVK
jgi:effector-binding domain-containing protein